MARTTSVRPRRGHPAARALAFLLTLAVTSRAGADPTQTLPCRPTIACTADIVPGGSFELEAGALLRTAAGMAATYSAPFLAKLSLTDWAQIQVGSAGPTWSDGQLVMDVAVFAAKVRLMPQGAWAPSVSLSLGGAFGVTPGSQSYQPIEGVQAALYASRDIGRFHVDVNVGYNGFTVSGSPVTHAYWAAVSTSVAWSSVFGTFHELYYFSPQVVGGGRDAGFLFGVTLSPSPSVMFDIGGDIALVQSTRTANAFFGVTFVTERLWGAAPATARGLRGPPIARTQIARAP